MNRRTALMTLAATAVAPSRSTAAVAPDVVASNDDAVHRTLPLQNMDPGSRWRGAITDSEGLHNPGPVAAFIARGVASYIHEESRYNADPELRSRLDLAADHLRRVQTADGNFDLLVTNFNSPPDSAFMMRYFGPAIEIAAAAGDDEIVGWLEPVALRAGEGLVKGGVHTPNHRWVVCAALAVLHRIKPDPRYLARIDQWLAEGIDIDADGQYSERSTGAYNAITDNALVRIADSIDRPELLDHVRANLEAMLYLLHPGGEVVTEISRRQDRNTYADMGRYWLALRYLARVDGDGRYETLVRSIEPRYASLFELMTIDKLREDGPAPAPLPDNYERTFTQSRLARIRRGPTSASILLDGDSRFFSLRRGKAVVNAVRFASAFFGKAQFVPDTGGKADGSYRLTQSLTGPYYQPFQPSRKQPWGTDSWYELRQGDPGREQTEVAVMDYTAVITERADGFDCRIVATGTDWVPFAVEINLRPGGTLTGVDPLEGTADAYLLRSGMARYRFEGDEIRFGPGIAETRYTAVRGAQPKLPGPSVYLTAYTPFDRTIQFRW